MYSGITSGRVLDGELLYTKILEVNLFAFAKLNSRIFMCIYNIIKLCITLSTDRCYQIEVSLKLFFMQPVCVCTCHMFRNISVEYSYVVQ